MKKVALVLSVFFVVTSIVSCKVQHEKCAAYSKANKVETEKVVTNKTLKSI
jgi:hypothetical protein